MDGCLTAGTVLAEIIMCVKPLTVILIPTGFICLGEFFFVLESRLFFLWLGEHTETSSSSGSVDPRIPVEGFTALPVCVALS